MIICVLKAAAQQRPSPDGPTETPAGRKTLFKVSLAAVLPDKYFYIYY